MARHLEPDEFDATVRRALDDVALATPPAPDLATRLVTGARTGSAVPSLAARRRAARWSLPLLAAAAVVVLAAGAAVGTTLLADDKHAPPAHTVSPVPTRSVTSSPTPSAVNTSPRTSRSSPGPSRSTRVSNVDVPVPDGFRGADVYFADTRHGWAIGDGRCGSGSATDCPALITTSDGGDSWHALRLPTGLVSAFDFGSCGSNGDIHGPCVDQVRFSADGQYGYVWSMHTFSRTRDGGRTWSSLGAPGATELEIVGQRAVRIGVRQLCSSGCAGLLQSAPLGSDRWQTATPGGRALSLGETTLQGIGSRVYVFGHAPDFGATTVGVLRSSDGGQNWTVVTREPCGPPIDSSDQLIAGAAAGSGAIVLLCNAPNGSERVRTANGDGGAVSAARPMPEPDFSGRVVQGSDRNHFLVAGWFNDHPHKTLALYATQDGGRTWQLRTLPAVATETYDPVFLTATDGYLPLSASHSVLVTQDGGQTWQPRQFA